MSNILTDLCEPVFVYVCYLNHCARIGDDISYTTAKSRMIELLDELNGSLNYGTSLWRQFKKIECALFFFIDSMVCESGISFAHKWDRNRLAYKQGELTGDKKFFDILEQLLEENSIDSEKCLPFFYYCISLGFTGINSDNPERLKYYLERIIDRAPYLKDDCKKLIYENVYSNVDSRNLLPKRWLTARKLIFLGILILFFFIVLNFLLFYLSTADLFGCFNRIVSIIYSFK